MELRRLVRPQRNAAEMIDLFAGHELNNEQSDYLDLLSDLYEKWESTQFTVSRATGAEPLHLMLAERRDGAGDLAELLGWMPRLGIESCAGRVS